MYDNEILRPATLVETVRATENEVEEAWRDSKLAMFLFHDDHLNRSISAHEEISDDTIETRHYRLFQLEQDFLQDKKFKDMSERFDLALDPKYLGAIHVVELGTTTNPGLNGEVDGLKHQYNSLLKHMKNAGIPVTEMERSKSGRNLSIRRPVLPEAADKYAVMVRNRPLINTKFEYDGAQVSVGIAKRMIFSVPLPSLKPLLAIDEDINSEAVQRTVEERFLAQGWECVMPIRTSYYLATTVKS